MENNQKSKKNAKNNKKKNNIENSNKISFISKRGLELTIYIALIVLILLVSFFGIYTKNQNTTVNKVKEYALGPDIDGYRNIVIKVNDSNIGNDGSNEESETVENNEVAEIVENDENVEEVDEESSNSETTINSDLYDKARKIIENRLKYMQLDYYEIKYNNTDGTILIKVPNDDNADRVAQYVVTKGEFKISDNDTKEVLMDNNDIKDAKVGYSTATAGTTIYLNIEFNKNGKEKLKEISSTYQGVENEEASEEASNAESEETSEVMSNVENEGTEQTETAQQEKLTKQVTLTLDDTTIITTAFEEEIDDGAIQLTLGTSSDRSAIQEYVEQATNIAVFLNSEAMPITYKLEVNELVYSELANPELLTAVIVFLIICYVITLIKLIVKHKTTGILGTLASIGLVSILLLTIRYANVEITFSGIFAIFGVAVLENTLLNSVFTIYLKDLDKETKDREMRKNLIREYEYLLPIAIISIVFAISKWKPVTSVGMILFWGILEIIIFNLINIKIICRKEEK